MATVTVKNIPDDLYELLKESAHSNRRSINSEIIVCIERQVTRQTASVEDTLRKARALRSLTSTSPITESQFDAAKRAGRL